MPCLIESRPSDGPTVRSSRVDELGRERARPEDEGEGVGALGGEVPLDDPVVP